MRAPTDPAARGSTIRLRDGRRLGYAEYGDPSGRPVFVFHGTPGARNAATFAHPTAQRRGIRLIAPDRPGYGLSDFQTDRTLLDWPDDVVQLADRLGISRFDIVGVSGGGPHAAACAFKLGARIRTAFLISPMGPVDDPQVLNEATKPQRVLLRIVQRRPWMMHLAVGLLGLGIRTAPKATIQVLFFGGAQADRKSLKSALVMRTMVDSFREGFRQGWRATACDIRLFSRPWGFRPRDIAIPVRLWHGDADANVPPVMSRVLSRDIPDSEVTILPGQGHLWVIENFDSIEEIGAEAP